MEIFKILTMIFAIAFVITLIFLGLNIGGNGDNSETNQELNSLKIDLQENIAKLNEKTEELNMSES
ncbi:MAG: hypothetical protein JSU91_05705, partial [Thermoplasmatales archaeon]